MPADFTDAELLAYLDEELPVARMTAIEQALRQSADLRERTSRLRARCESQGHSVGEIWRRGRLSCPSRHQLGSYLLGALPADLAQYVLFHLETIGCRWCTANLDDLRQSAASQPEEAAHRRQKIFASSAGHVRSLRERR